MKTAKIDVYKMYGTTRYVADVWYKGRIIREFNENHIDHRLGTIPGLEQIAIEYVLQNGFTDYKLIN